MAASLLALGLCAGASRAHASWMVPPAPYRPKDFTIVKKDGVYHIFYIRRDVTLPGSTERDFGHAISTDLYHWSQLPPVLAVRDSNWDNEHVWAPSIVLKDGVYYMFYTGVTAVPGIYDHEQRTGVATSTDLMTWNRMDAPVQSCATVPWTFCDSLSAQPGFRDPFVMPDPNQPGHYLMYYTATAGLDSSSMVVGVSSSDGNLTAWSDLKPLWATYKTYSGSGIIESPHAFQHDNLWYLFYTTGAIQPLAFLAGPDPLADPGGWPYSVRLSAMLGYSTFSWFASEHLGDGLHDYLCFVNADRIEMYEMAWQGPAHFSLFQPDLFHVVKLHWSRDSIVAGASTPLVFESVNWTNRSAAIEAIAIDSLGVETPVPLDSLGLPSSIPMTADTVRWNWTARRWPGAGSAPMRLVVRLVDRTAATPVALTVLPDTLAAPPDTTLDVTGIQWSVSDVRPGGQASLIVTASGWRGHSVPILAFTPDLDGNLVSVPLDSLGLPAAIPLTGATTIFPWTARVWPASGDTTQVMRLLIRYVGGAPETGMLRVGPDSLAPPPDTTLHVLAMNWMQPRVRRGETATLRVMATNAAGRTMSIEAFQADSSFELTPVPIDSVGLPAALTLTGDTTLVAWTARRWVGAVADTDTLRLVIRRAGEVLGTGVLAIEPDSIAAPPDTAFRVTGLAWQLTQVRSGDPAPLTVTALHAAGRWIAIEAFHLSAPDLLTPVPTDSVGVPGTIDLTGDTTTVVCHVRRWGGVVGPADTLRLVLRLAGETLGTGPLAVAPDSIVAPPDTAFRVTALAWKVTEVFRGKPAPLCVIAHNAVGRSAAIAAFTLDAAGTLWPAPLDSLGLPAALALAGDTTIYTWTARTWPDTSGSAKSTRVVLRATQFGRDTGPLVVWADTVATSPGPVGPVSGEDGPPSVEEGIRLRQLNRAAATSAPQFLIELPVPMPARLDVFDVMGRRLRNLADRVLPAGASVLRWDGRDAVGRPARAGVYFARLTTVRGVRITRAVLLP